MPVIEFIKDHGGIFGLLGFVVAVLALFYPFRRDRISDTVKEFCDPEFRNDILGKRNQTIGTAYFAALEWLNTRSDRFYGSGLLTFRAFERCLLLALVYPVVGVLVAWIAFGTYGYQEVMLLTPTDTQFERIRRALVLSFFVAALITCLLKYRIVTTSVCAWFNQRQLRFAIPGKIPSAIGILVATSFLAAWLYLTIVVTAIWGGFFVGGMFVIAFVTAVSATYRFGAMGLASVIAVFFVFKLGEVTFKIHGNILPSVSIGLPDYSIGDEGLVGIAWGGPPTHQAFLFFVFFVPIANALADIVSLAMTRKFLKWAALNKPGVPAIIVAAFLDTIWGMLCLFGLLYLLTIGLDLWQSLSPTTLPIDWREYWAEIRDDPRQGLALWLMALTTLLPTFIHIIVGLTAMLTHASRRRVEALDELEQVCGTDSFTEARQRAIATKLVNADTYTLLLSSTFLLIAIYALWQVSEVVLPYLSNWHLLFPS
jgi:hypothetical protein